MISQQKKNLKFYILQSKKIQDDIERLSINTCISQLMITVNELNRLKCNKKEILEPLIIICSPFAPHICEELWQKIGKTSSVMKSDYPKINNNYLIDAEYEYPIMINGKLRVKQKFSIDSKDSKIKDSVLKNDIVMKWTKDQKIKKVIIVRKKIINIVV